MTTSLIKLLSVFSISMLKFVFGPLTGAAMGLSVVETWAATVAGMMFTVLGIAYAGTELRRRIFQQYFKKKRKFTPYNRRMVRIWNKYGIAGVAFLTPIFLSPPIGAILAVAFGEKRHKIVVSMLISGIAWGLILSLLFTFGKSHLDGFLQQFSA